MRRPLCSQHPSSLLAYHILAQMTNVLLERRVKLGKIDKRKTARRRQEPNRTGGRGERMECAKYAARGGRHAGYGLQRAAQAGQGSGAAQIGVRVGIPGAEEGGDGDPDRIAAPGALTGQGGLSGAAVPVSTATAAAAAAAITIASTHGNSPNTDCGGREASAQSILCACRREVPVPFSFKEKEPKRTSTGPEPGLPD